MNKLLLLLIFFPTFLFSQTEQTGRVELEMKSSKRKYETIPVKEYGVILFTESDDRGKNFSNWLFTMLDTDFKEKWNITVAINDKLRYNDFCLDDRFLYLIFTNHWIEEYSIIKIDFSTGEVKEIKGSYLKRFMIHSFKIKNDQMYIEGSYKGESALGYIDLDNTVFRILPITFEGVSSIENISFEKDSDLATVVFLNRIKRKESYLSLVSFRNGKKENYLLINSIPGKNIVSARLNVLANGEKLIIGTYGEGGRFSNGMYICKFSGNDQKYIKFYNFNDMENFLSYLSEKKQERFKEKIEKKEAQGKELNFDYNLLVHDIIERENEYLLIAEVYYATYRTETYTTTVPGPTGPQMVLRMRTVFDGWLYTHALIAGFSQEGKLLWDNTFEMGDFKSFVLKERITVSAENNNKKIMLTYGFGNSIRTKIIEENKVIDKKEKVAIETKNEEDKVKFSSTTIEYWFGDYFLAYGSQKIKNNEIKQRRNVFYFNKIAYK